MSQVNPEPWAGSHTGGLALSGWDNESGTTIEPLAHALAGAGVSDLTHRIGLAADHGGFLLKVELARSLRVYGCDVVDFGAYQLDPEDDYPDFVVPLARAIASGELARGIALCASGIGVCIAANKFPGVRAGLVHDVFSAHQGVESDDMNLACMGGTVIGTGVALDLVRVFLNARFSGEPSHRRRLAKVRALEHPGLLTE